MKKSEKQIDIEKEIEKAISQLLDKLEIKAKISINKGEEEQEPDHYQVNIETEETGLLIGRRGETLNSLQLILGVILYKRVGKWVRVILDVGEYRKKRQESIKEMVMRIVQEVEKDNVPVTLPYLTPLERRNVHLLLAQHEKVTTESVGLGKDRRLIIKPR